MNNKTIPAADFISMLTDEENFTDITKEPLPKLLKGGTLKDVLLTINPDTMPKALDKYGMIYEGQKVVIVGSTGVSKSTCAMQFAIEKAEEGYNCLIVDSENGPYVTYQRLASRNLPENIFWFEPDPENFDSENFESNILQVIKQLCLENHIDIVIIDNLTWICNDSEDGKKAGEFMRNLNMMFREMNTTVIVLAHTPKRPNSAPITENDLAGSRKLLNFFESAIAINKSIKGANRRYIKQLKNRMRPIEYGADNVIEIELTDEGGWLHANVIGTSKEGEHLRVWSQEDYEENSKKCAEMKAAGKSQNEIGKELGLSQATVSRMLKRQQKS